MKKAIGVLLGNITLATLVAFLMAFVAIKFAAKSSETVTTENNQPSGETNETNVFHAAGNVNAGIQ